MQKIISSFIACLILTSILGSLPVYAGVLAIKRNSMNPAYLVYQGKPILAYGPSPQNILTYLPRGDGNDVRDWAEWARKFGIKHVRSYPPSVNVNEPAENLFVRSSADSRKFDLNSFNDKYFDQLARACALLKQYGILVHLQFWQAVYWKKAWQDCYYNSKNNVNPDISNHAGPGEFVSVKNPELLHHQKRYVKKILDATGHFGNVFYDIMNEIGNGTGKNENWVWEIIRTVNDWEKKHNINVLLTLNDEGGMRMGNFSLECQGLDLAVKDLGRYDEHRNTKLQYLKPTISVRNIDYDYQLRKRTYFGGSYNLEINKDKALQTRGRKYWWRMFMAGVQIGGAYADTYLKKDFSWILDKMTDKLALPRVLSLNSKASYRQNHLAEQNFIPFKKFLDLVYDYESLRPFSGILAGHPVTNSYCLQSDKQAIGYIESPNGKAGFDYNQTKARLTNLMLKDGKYKGTWYFPYNGHKEHFSMELKGGEGEVLVPPFRDDLALSIQ